jgi:uncharacterized 2Fe-2S/4Fe-4S cluster protein (DUF4445 family)
MARQVHGTKGQTLLEAMRSEFPNAEAPCGGSGRCGRCRARIQGEGASRLSQDTLLTPVGDDEARLLGPENIRDGWRLSCLARFTRPGVLRVEQQERVFFLPDGEEGASAVPGGKAALCAAADIGTTTISCALAEISTGRIVARAAAANRQRSFGPDVVSRIEHAVREPGTLTEMRDLVRGQVGGMLDGLCRKAGGIRPETIHICGNTTMLHIWEGADLAGLSRMPFQPEFLESRKTELKVDGGGTYACRLLPGISAFVGADIAAGILACNLPTASGRPELLVDIGTNGEIVLASEGRILATATAAGPAFEGVSVSSGMPAVDGAVDHVAWRDGKFSFTTLGELPPAGFCGSGLLDLLACLRRAGLLEESGALNAAPGPDGSRAFPLPSDPPLLFTQADVRQLQLAKGAIAAGIRVLCRRAGVALADVGRVSLAGSFGSRLSPDSALAVGLMPEELAGRIEAAGNTALAGALMTARDPAALERCVRTAADVRVLDLSREAGFEDAFADAMRFPTLGG